VLLLVERAAGFHETLDRLRTAAPAWVLVALAGEALSFAGFSLALRELAGFEGGPRLGVFRSVRLVFASLGAARAVAGGGPAAIAVLYGGLRRTGAGRDAAAIRVVALYALLFGTFGAGAWLAAVLTLAEGHGLALPHLTLPWLIGVPLVVAAAALVRAHEPAPSPRRLVRFIRRAAADAAAGLLVVRRIVAHPRAEAAALAAAVLYWAGDALCLWAALRAFDLSLPPRLLVLAYATGYLATLLPLPLGGFGVVETVTTLALRGVGVPLAAGLLAVLAYRAINFWLPTLPGLAAFAAHLKPVRS
jgi:uncharacterized membrane protein YbhN (UPF0104 family)